MEPKYRYKNISGVKQILVGIGEVIPDGIIETTVLINNSNFELLTVDDRKVGVDPVGKAPKK